MPEDVTPEQRLREATARLLAANDRARDWMAGYEKRSDAPDRVDAVVGRLTRMYLPAQRPKLTLIQGGRED